MKAVDQILLDSMGLFSVMSYVGTGIGYALRFGLSTIGTFGLLKPWLQGAANLGGTSKEVRAYLGSKESIGTAQRAELAAHKTKFNELTKARNLQRIKIKSLSFSSITLQSAKKAAMEAELKSILAKRRGVVIERRALLESFATRGRFAANGMRFLNIAYWVYTAYDLITTAWDVIETSSSHKVNLAGLLAGENFLTMLPLEYKGTTYVAGMEGIIGSPRAFSTMLLGELKGKEGKHRALYILGSLGEKVSKI